MHKIALNALLLWIGYWLDQARQNLAPLAVLVILGVMLGIGAFGNP